MHGSGIQRCARGTEPSVNTRLAHVIITFDAGQGLLTTKRHLGKHLCRQLASLCQPLFWSTKFAKFRRFQGMTASAMTPLWPQGEQLRAESEALKRQALKLQTEQATGGGMAGRMTSSRTG